MKKIIYLTGFWLLGFSLWTGSVSAQAVFNDTIYFQILKTRPTNIGAKYLMTFGTEAGSTNKKKKKPRKNFGVIIKLATTYSPT